MVVNNVKVHIYLPHHLSRGLIFVAPVVEECTEENDGMELEANSSCSVCTCKVCYY